MNPDVTQPYDRFFRKTMSDVHIAREFFAARLPQKIKDLFDWNTLTLCPESFIDEHLKSSMTDILYSACLKGKASESHTETKSYFYLLVEHQSTVRADMPFRLMQYMMKILERYQETNEENINAKLLPKVLSLCQHSQQVLKTDNRIELQLV